MLENTQQERHSWLKLITLLSFMALLAIMEIAGGGENVALNMDDPDVLNRLRLFQTVSVFILFIMPALMFATLWTNQKIHYLGVTTKPKFSTVLIAGAGILLAMPLINWLSGVNQQLQLPPSMHNIEAWMKTSEATATELSKTFTKGTSVGVLLINLLIAGLLAAVSEELFFRGLVQKVSIECFKNRHVGVWFAAIIFSASHMQFYGFLPRMLMGAYLGYLFLWSGSLWPGIVAHFLNNGTIVFMMWLVNRGVLSEDADKVGTLKGEMIMVVISTASVALCIWFVRKIEARRRNEIVVREV